MVELPEKPSFSEFKKIRKSETPIHQAPKLSEVEDPFPKPVSEEEFKELVFVEGMKPTLPIEKEPKIGEAIFIGFPEKDVSKNMGIVEKIEMGKGPNTYKITTELGSFEAVLRTENKEK